MNASGWVDRIAGEEAARRHAVWTFAFVTAATLALLVAWDFSGLDMVLAAPFAGPGGFALRDGWFLTTVLHGGGRWLSWLLALWLMVGIVRPTGVLRRLTPERRVQLALTAVLSVALVSVLKSVGGTSCPWELRDYGGSLPHHLSHWRSWLGGDGGSGHCFPAGHASSGFAFIGGYFAFRETSSRVARWWLAAAVLAGLVLGIGQQVRGAHFMSHTLWTAWLCWAMAWMVDVLWLACAPLPEGEA